MYNYGKNVDSELLRAVGDKLRVAISSAGYTQEQIAAEIGMLRPHLNDALAGKRALPLDKFINICILVDCDPAEPLRLEMPAIAELDAEIAKSEEALRNCHQREAQAVGTPEYSSLKKEADRLAHEIELKKRRRRFLSRLENNGA